MFNRTLNRALPAKNVSSDLPNVQEINQQLDNIKTYHTHLSRLINLEIWAIVGTMEDFYPGFWNRFMVNRKEAFQEFLAQKNAKSSRS